MARVCVRLLALVLLLSSHACGNDAEKPSPREDAAPPPPPPPRLARPQLALPPPAKAPLATLGKPGDIAHPVRQPLLLAPRVEPDAETPSAPMRVQALLPIPERRLAAASGKNAAGLAVELIDIENGTILWRDTERCSGPVVHASTDRVICAGWKGIVALDVDSGRPAWTSPLLFRAAGAGYVVARDAASVTVGAIMDVATGRSLTRVQMPEGYDLEEVRYLCADKGGFDLFSWSPAGELRRFHLGRREEIAYLAWVRRLRQEPSRLDPCDPVILVETPIPGRPDRGLRALTFKKGKLLGPQVEQSGWWPAMASSAQAGDIEIVTADGLELRDRKLGNIRSRSKGFVGGRVLASWANQRLVRSVAGTALLIDENGIQQWLGAPANIAQVVLTPSHLLAGPWAGSSRSGAENLVLYRMPKARPRAFEAAPRAPPPPPPLTTASLHRMPKQETPPVATFAFPEQGDFEVTRVALAGETLYLTAGPNPPRPGRGIGLAAFDLARRSWTWYREQACAANAEVVGIAITDDAIVCATRELYPGPGVLSALARDSGTPMWTVKLPTVDRVVGASGTVVALAGSQALVIDAARGEQTYELFADNGHLPRAVLVAGLVIAVEPDGHIVARSPDGTPRWSVAVAGYISELRAMADAVAVHTHAGELYMLDAGTGASRAVDGKSMQWKDSGGGDLAFDSARGRQGELILWAYDARGQERFRAAYPTIIDWQPAPLRSAHADAPVLLVSRGKQPRLMHIDPRDGQVQARHLAPSPVYRDSVFSAVVKGRPQVGLVLREGPSVQLY